MRLLTLLLGGAVAGLVVASAASPAGGGTISAAKIGPLSVGRATQAQLVAFAGKPAHVWTFATAGRIPGNGIVAKGVRVVGYGCGRPLPARGCATLYAFKAGKLIGFFTRSPAFHTAAGTHVGTSLPRALEREEAIWSGFQVQCPALSYPAAVEFKANVVRGPARVADFLVTASPRSFSDGC